LAALCLIVHLRWPLPYNLTMLMRSFYLILGLLGVAWAGGCSPYVDDYYYTPRPAMVQVQQATSQPSAPPAAAMISVVGVRYADDSAHLPETVEINMRLDNTGTEQVNFDPRSLVLTNGQFIAFGQAVVDPPTPVSLAPNQSAILDVLFPFPQGLTYRNSDLESLQLRWQVQIGSTPVGQTADFRRTVTYYYSPYYYYPPPYYYGWGGVVVIHRRF
jgi:hypothetical protein